MENNKISNIAVVFGRDEDRSFNRCTFPILGREVAKYPILAALNFDKLDAVYLSTDSQEMLGTGESIKEVNVLKRKKSQSTLTEDVRHALKAVIEKLGSVPNAVTILFKNSPSSTSRIVDESISFSKKNPSYDSGD